MSSLAVPLTIADAALASFLDAYWDPGHFSPELWDLAMDAYERDGVHESLVHAVYDGVGTFDDIAWWAQGCARAYELTGLARYLDRARELLDSNWDAAGNGPAAIAAVKVYAATGDTSYLDRAQALYSRTRRQPRRENAGISIGAATALYGATRDGSYLSDALSTADRVVTDWAVTQPRVLSGDAKAIVVRQLHRLAVELGQPQYLPFLQHNAEQAWRNRRTSDGLIGPDWSSPTPPGPLDRLTACEGAALLQIVAL
jgi:rhamnogalacturonyl hydrolase YesR